MPSDAILGFAGIFFWWNPPRHAAKIALCVLQQEKRGTKIRIRIGDYHGAAPETGYGGWMTVLGGCTMMSGRSLRLSHALLFLYNCSFGNTIEKRFNAVRCLKGTWLNIGSIDAARQPSPRESVSCSSTLQGPADLDPWWLKSPHSVQAASHMSRSNQSAVNIVKSRFAR